MQNKADANIIPLVGISRLRSSTEPHTLANQLYAASKDLGVYLKRHGIPDAAIAATRTVAVKFTMTESLISLNKESVFNCSLD